MINSPFSADKHLPTPDTIRVEESRVKWGRYNLQTSLITEFGLIQSQPLAQTEQSTEPQKHTPTADTSANVISFAAAKEQADEAFANDARQNIANAFKSKEEDLRDAA